MKKRFLVITNAYDTIKTMIPNRTKIRYASERVIPGETSNRSFLDIFELFHRNLLHESVAEYIFRRFLFFAEHRPLVPQTAQARIYTIDQ